MTDKSASREAARKEEAPAPPRVLAPEAQRAVAEAEERRRKRRAEARAAEVGGRGGLDPARYGDWEVNGLATDF